jgi:hypothetical protein
MRTRLWRWLILCVNLTELRDARLACNTLFLGMSMRLFWEGTNIWIYRLNKEDLPLPTCVSIIQSVEGPISEIRVLGPSDSRSYTRVPSTLPLHSQGFKWQALSAFTIVWANFQIDLLKNVLCLHRAIDMDRYRHTHRQIPIGYFSTEPWPI